MEPAHLRQLCHPQAGIFLQQLHRIFNTVVINELIKVTPGMEINRTRKIHAVGMSHSRQILHGKIVLKIWLLGLHNTHHIVKQLRRTGIGINILHRRLKSGPLLPAAYLLLLLHADNQSGTRINPVILQHIQHRQQPQANPRAKRPTPRHKHPGSGKHKHTGMEQRRILLDTCPHRRTVEQWQYIFQALTRVPQNKNKQNQPAHRNWSPKRQRKQPERDKQRQRNHLRNQRRFNPRLGARIKHQQMQSAIQVNTQTGAQIPLPKQDIKQREQHPGGNRKNPQSPVNTYF